MQYSLDYSANKRYIYTMKRYIYNNILKDLKKKMVFITGPRQVGKTYLSKELGSTFKSVSYLNYDDLEGRKTINDRSWPLSNDLIIFDEIHKMKNWKQYLKGTFDTKQEHQQFLITGSARLETFRQTGESLAGRYFHYRLNPISVKELSNNISPYNALSSLNKLGGFPEPFLSGAETEANRWRKQYYIDLVREDILDFSRITEIKAIRLLLEMLRKRVGSTISFSSLAGDLQVSPNTIKKYINILESLYIIFIIRPFHKNIARSLLKEPKIYFYDTGYVDGDDGTKLENSVAVCLLKHIQYLQDTEGRNITLNYIRTKEEKEIDFVIAEDNKIDKAIEVKLSEKELASNVKYFKSKYPDINFIQLVHNLKQQKEVNGVLIAPAGDWLAELSA